MLVVTTNTIEGRTVTRYHSIVSVNIVAGTGFSSGFAATPIGHLRVEQHVPAHLDQLDNEALSALGDEPEEQRKHSDGRADRLQRVRGKGTQMFMVTPTHSRQLIAPPAQEPTPNNGTREDSEGAPDENSINTRIAGTRSTRHRREAVESRLSGYRSRFVETSTNEDAAVVFVCGRNRGFD